MTMLRRYLKGSNALTTVNAGDIDSYRAAPKAPEQMRPGGGGKCCDAFGEPSASSPANHLHWVEMCRASETSDVKQDSRHDQVNATVASKRLGGRLPKVAALVTSRTPHISPFDWRQAFGSASGLSNSAQPSINFSRPKFGLSVPPGPGSIRHN